MKPIHGRSIVSYTALILAALLFSAAAATNVAYSPAVRPPHVLPEGTELSLILVTPLSSVASRPGDLVVTTLAERVGPDATAPAGSAVTGRILAVERAGGPQGRAHLSFTFDTLVIAGKRHAIRTGAIAISIPDASRQDASWLLDADPATRASFVSASPWASGSGVLMTKRSEVELDAGTRYKVKLLVAAPLPVDVAAPRGDMERWNVVPWAPSPTPVVERHWPGPWTSIPRSAPSTSISSTRSSAGACLLAHA